MKKFFYFVSIMALCLGAASCEKPGNNDNIGNNENNNNNGSQTELSLDYKWLVTIDNSFTEGSETVEDINTWLVDLSEQGYVRVGLRSTGYIAEGLEANQFVERLPKTACTVAASGETAGTINIDLGEGEVLTIAYSDLSVDGVKLLAEDIFESATAQPASIYTETVDWVVIPDEGEGEQNQAADINFVWQSQVSIGGYNIVYCFDLSGLNPEGTDTTVDANGDYGKYIVGALAGNYGEMEDTGRITYYSAQTCEMDFGSGESKVTYTWVVTDTGITLSTPEGDFVCTKYTGDPIEWE